MESNLRNRIVIDIDQLNNVTVNIFGDMKNDVAMIGACSIAEQFVKNKLLGEMKLVNKMPQNHIHNEDKSCYSKNEIELKKSEALNFYLDKRLEIEKKMKEIVSEDDNQATFRIKKFKI